MLIGLIKKDILCFLLGIDKPCLMKTKAQEKNFFKLLIFFLALLPSRAWANLHVMSTQAAQDKYKSLTIETEAPEQLTNAVYWLNKIASTDVGQETLKTIKKCGSRVTLVQNELASLEAGRTVAEASSKLWDGEGEDATIFFNFDMPNQGEYWVPGLYGNLVAFTADENLFHELSHAMHKSCGTEYWKDPESQAIQDENRYREALAQLAGEKTVRRGKVGIVPRDSSME